MTAANREPPIFHKPSLFDSVLPAVLDQRIAAALQATLMALLIVAALVPTDTPAVVGMFVQQAMLWCLLALAACAYWAWSPRANARWDAIDCVAVAYLGWTIVAAIAVVDRGDLRAAANSAAQTVSFVIAFLLSRRLFAAPQARRAGLRIMMSLAISLALLGCLQYFYLQPIAHAELHAHEDQVLMENGYVPGSAAASAFLNRAYSREPLATFSLTNSLAAFLLPWSLLLLALWWRSTQAVWLSWRVAWPAATLTTLGLLALATCLLLTKSRTSLLALGVGVGLLMLMLVIRGVRDRTPRKNSVRLAAAFGFVGLLAFASLATAVWRSGGLDRQVLSEAPLSVQYRLQYWHSALVILLDHWLLGCGPGNFKNVYPRYMLPQASEVIGDPHNFVLEIAATAGLPALVLFLTWLGLVFFRTKEHQSSEDAAIGAGQEDQSPDISACSTNRAPLYGALAGLLIAGPLVVLVGSSNDSLAGIVPWFTVIGIPVVVVGYFYLSPPASSDTPLLVSANEAPWLLKLVSCMLLLNLLAAGGVGFPNVALALAMLLAFCTTQLPVQNPSLGSRSNAFHKPLTTYIALAGAVVLTGTCYRWVYVPVLMSRGAALQAATLQQEGDLLGAIQRQQAAVAADPWGSEACSVLAALEMQRYQTSPNRVIFDSCQLALQTAIARDPKSHLPLQAAGDAYLMAFRGTGQRDNLTAAVKHYQQAMQRSPNNSASHARLAWTKHLQGDSEAGHEARRALELDAFLPDRDQHLGQRAGLVLRDPGLTFDQQWTRLRELIEPIAANH